MLRSYEATFQQRQRYCHITFKGEVSREFGVFSKTPKRFLYQHKPKNIGQSCCRLSPQCTRQGYRWVSSQRWIG